MAIPSSYQTSGENILEIAQQYEIDAEVSWIFVASVYSSLLINIHDFHLSKKHTHTGSEIYVILSHAYPSVKEIHC